MQNWVTHLFRIPSVDFRWTAVLVEAPRSPAPEAPLEMLKAATPLFLRPSQPSLTAPSAPCSSEIRAASPFSRWTKRKLIQITKRILPSPLLQYILAHPERTEEVLLSCSINLQANTRALANYPTDRALLNLVHLN